MIESRLKQNKCIFNYHVNDKKGQHWKGAVLFDFIMVLLIRSKQTGFNWNL